MCFPAASSEPAFSARFFLVVVELTPTGRSLLHMWHLHLAARPVTMGGCFERRTYLSKDVAKNKHNISYSCICPHRRDCHGEGTHHCLFHEQLSV